MYLYIVSTVVVYYVRSILECTTIVIKRIMYNLYRTVLMAVLRLNNEPQKFFSEFCMWFMLVISGSLLHKYIVYEYLYF